MREVSDASFTGQRCPDLAARALRRRWIKDGPGQIENETVQNIPRRLMRGVSDASFTGQRCPDLAARAFSRRWISDGPGQIENELSEISQRALRSMSDASLHGCGGIELR